MRLCSIGSGSSGNCIYIGSEKTHILVDAGISCKRVEMGLQHVSLTARDLSGILITHEHSDHIQGLGVLARKYGVPIYATKGTMDGILHGSRQLGDFDVSLFREVCTDTEVRIGDLNVRPFHISHDANDPCGYRIECEEKKVAIATDMGTFDSYTVEQLQGLDAILLEANHDVRLLQVGPYSYALKQRVLSDFGHLSNENSGLLLNRILHKDLKHIMLGHLSKENNMPEIAFETVKFEIDVAESPFKAEDFHICVAMREKESEILNF